MELGIFFLLSICKKKINFELGKIIMWYLLEISFELKNFQKRVTHQIWIGKKDFVYFYIFELKSKTQNK